MGKQVDIIDKAFYIWKKCIQCATGSNVFNLYAYSYDVTADSCGKNNYFVTRLLKITLESSSDESRPICECDRKLLNFLAGSTGEHNNYNVEFCVKAESTDVRAKCCLYDNFIYQSYNSERFCCGVTGVKKIGFC